ncbi:MAG: hypothetical protein ACRDB0_05370, partial [Paraclostridium sp.]
MKKQILINFLHKEKRKSKQLYNGILIPIIAITLLIIGINGNLKYKISKLEKYIESNYEYTTVSNLDYNIEKNLIPIANIVDITKLINDQNINNIKISNNKLNLLGYSYDSSIIKTYSDRLYKNNKINNVS